MKFCKQFFGNVWMGHRLEREKKKPLDEGDSETNDIEGSTRYLNGI